VITGDIDTNALTAFGDEIDPRVFGLNAPCGQRIEVIT
jgi:hypothetical protein